MKILQLNIWGGKLGKQIVELIERERPDVVCFQEAIVLPHEGTLLFTQYGDIQKETGFEHSYFSPAFGFTMMNHRADFGNAIMSRTPFVSQNTVFTRGDYNPTIDLVDGDYNMRNLQHAVVQHNEKDLHILNHHGHHLRQHKMGDEETLRQCTMIADYIHTLEGDVVLCGDFNLAPESESLGVLNSLLTNHCIESGATTTRTVLTHKTEVCDYIFTSRGLSAKNFKVLPDIASDHAALTVEIG
jgi:endonuclease/exonuclease/phosphatase family metal-dependent hydrolase